MSVWTAWCWKCLEVVRLYAGHKEYECRECGSTFGRQPWRRST